MISHEKIIKRDDGKKIRIHVSFSDRGKYRIISVDVCQPGKRTFIAVVDTNSHSYRHAPDREAYAREKYLAVISEDEIMTAKMELWRNMCPASDACS